MAKTFSGSPATTADVPVTTALETAVATIPLVPGPGLITRAIGDAALIIFGRGTS